MTNYYDSRQYFENLKLLLKRRNPAEELPSDYKVVMVQVDGIDEPVQATYHKGSANLDSKYRTPHWYVWTFDDREYEELEDEQVLYWWYMPGSLPEEACR